MPIDRIEPSRREACRTRKTGQQTWRDLLFLHYEVPVDVLRRLVPAALSIDTFEGRAYVGVVPFTMHAVRFGPLPLPDFLETNLRTYVHAGGVPGVWFFSLDAANALAVWGGRTLYRLPYHRAKMECAAGGASCDYRMEREARGAAGASLDVRWTTDDGPAWTARADTLEHFLTERYSLYGEAGGGQAYRIRVHHPPWPLRRARVSRCRCTLTAAAGIDAGEPIDLVLASAEGVAVETFARERLPRAT